MVYTKKSYQSRPTAILWKSCLEDWPLAGVCELGLGGGFPAFPGLVRVAHYAYHPARRSSTFYAEHLLSSWGPGIWVCARQADPHMVSPQQKVWVLGLQQASRLITKLTAQRTKQLLWDSTGRKFWIACAGVFLGFIPHIFSLWSFYFVSFAVTNHSHEHDYIQSPGKSLHWGSWGSPIHGLKLILNQANI